MYSTTSSHTSVIAYLGGATTCAQSFRVTSTRDSIRDPTRERVVPEVELERERAEVQRLDPEGRAVASSTSVRDTEEQPRRPARGRR
jgi:hypothetical protein